MLFSQSVSSEEPEQTVVGYLSIILAPAHEANIVESLSGDILQKSMKDFYTKPKLELHSKML